jgi:hypothetical protein
MAKKQLMKTGFGGRYVSEVAVADGALHSPKPVGPSDDLNSDVYGSAGGWV